MALREIVESSVEVTLVPEQLQALIRDLMTGFQAYAQANGLEAVEAKITERYVENLKRYQDAGFYTDIVTD